MYNRKPQQKEVIKKTNRITTIYSARLRGEKRKTETPRTTNSCSSRKEHFPYRLSHCHANPPPSVRPFAFPSSHSVTVMNPPGCSPPRPSSAFSIVCVSILPFSSNSNINIPQNPPCSTAVVPPRTPTVSSPPTSVVRHFTTNLSPLSMRSLSTWSLRSRLGRRPHATGEVHSAAI